MKAAHKYYSEPGVREICHEAKEMNPQAIKTIATDLKHLIGANDKNVLLIPIPSHNGYATYTLEIAKEMGMPYLDILKCNKRQSLYSLKKKGITIDPSQLGFYNTELLPAEVTSNKNIYFVDNVYSTGITEKAAQAIFPKGEVLAYAYDETL